MKKFKTFALITLIASLFIVITLASLWYLGIYFKKTGDGITYFGKYALANELETKALSDVSIFLPKSVVSLNTKDFATVRVSYKDTSFKHYLTKHDLDVVYDWEIDESTLLELLKEESSCNVDAKLLLDSDGKISLQDEIYGNCFDLSDAVTEVSSNLKRGSPEVHLESLCEPPKVSAKDLKPLFEEINWVNDFEISYDMHTSSKDVINAETLKSCWDSDWNFDINKFDIDSFLDNLNSLYDTTDSYYTMKTTGGKKITAHYNTYGKHLNKEAEKEFILNAIESNTSYKKRHPELSGYDSDLNSTSDYIEVSIKDQHVWHYVNFKLCCESDCVTGTQNRHDTPTGVFYVSEKVPGKYLRGDNYTTWVNQWMRLTNSGIGLHDAYWRGSFGGSIYKSNGSHGCINLPKSYAENLYSEIDRGLPVIIYNE